MLTLYNNSKKQTCDKQTKSNQNLARPKNDNNKSSTTSSTIDHGYIPNSQRREAIFSGHDVVVSDISVGKQQQ